LEAKQHNDLDLLIYTENDVMIEIMLFKKPARIITLVHEYGSILRNHFLLHKEVNEKHKG